MHKNLIRAGRIFLAVMFLFSGISKLLSIAFFDAMVAELFLGPNYYDFPSGLYWTQILTRILISVELVLGISILVDKWVKKISVPAIFGMLLLFTVHLFYEGLTSDKGFIEGNCGCFGDVLPMNNLESIIKNIVAMLVAVYIWLRYKHEETLAVWVSPLVVGLVTFGTLLFGVKSYEAADETLDITNTTALLDSNLIDKDTFKVVEPTVKDTAKATKTVDEKEGTNPKTIEPSPQPKPTGVLAMLDKLGPLSDGQKMDLSNGDVAVCLFSMTCGHCQESYKEMCELSKNASLPKLYLINFGKEFEQKYFFNQAGGCKHPYYRTEDYTEFNRMLQGKGFPRILALKDGKIVQDWDIDTYNKDVFTKHFGIKEKPKEEPLIKKNDDNDINDLGGNPWD